MKTLYIGAGHDNARQGAEAFGYTESGLMSQLRDWLAVGLSYKMINVTTDGFGNVNETLLTALDLIKEHKPDMAIELHLNGSSDPSANGVECLALPRLRRECQQISQNIAMSLRQRLRGDYGYVRQEDSQCGKLAFVEAGGIIVELFFLTHKPSLDKYLAKRKDVAYNLGSLLYSMCK